MSNKVKYDTVIFDLDGTLLDTSEGIFGSVRYAEEKLCLDPVRRDQLSEFIGPPPGEIYKKMYHLDEETAKKAVSFHREYGRTKAIFQAKIYPGVEEVLRTLRKKGLYLAVATLKSQKIAEKVLSLNGIYNEFDVVIGMNREESYQKEDIIRMVLNQIRESKHAVLVGDSRYDQEGAKAVGIDFVGVLYGFGLKKEEKYPFSTIVNIMELLGSF